MPKTVKTVFVAHPMTGDIEGNSTKVTAICREIHSEEIIPIFPSFTTRRYLTPDPKDRELAAAHILEYFNRGMIDEVWLYGDKITEGMLREIKTAWERKIPVVGKTPETREFLAILELDRVSDKHSMDYIPAVSPEPIRVGRTDCPLAVFHSHPDFPNTLSPELEGAWSSLNPAWPEATIRWILDRLVPPCQADWELSNADNTEQKNGLSAVVVYVKPGKEKKK